MTDGQRNVAMVALCAVMVAGYLVFVVNCDCRSRRSAARLDELVDQQLVHQAVEDAFAEIEGDNL